MCTNVGECHNFVKFYPAFNCSYVMLPSCTWHLLWPGAGWLHTPDVRRARCSPEQLQLATHYTLLATCQKFACFARRPPGRHILQQPVCAAHRLLPALPGHCQEQQAAPLCALQLHAGAPAARLHTPDGCGRTFTSCAQSAVARHSSAVLLLLSIGGEADAYLHRCFICTSYQQCCPS